MYKYAKPFYLDTGKTDTFCIILQKDCINIQKTLPFTAHFLPDKSHYTCISTYIPLFTYISYYQYIPIYLIFNLFLIL